MDKNKNNIICPFCKSTNTYVYRSLAFKIILTVIFLPAVLLFLYPKYRCRDCKKMFNNTPINTNDQNNKINTDFEKKKKIITIVIIILVLGICIYKITNFVLTQINTIAQQ